MKILRLVPLATLALLGLTANASRARADKDPPLACVRWHGETQARALGYDHLVIVENACARPAVCVVSTDVAPEPIRVTVDVKQRIDLTTFRGSPSTTFTPRVDCKLQ